MTEDDYKSILKENETLRKELYYFHEQKKKSLKFRVWFLQSFSKIFLGADLKRSLSKLYTEIPKGKVAKETLVDVTANIIWRFTRIGFFLLFVSILPFIILIVQTRIMKTQNSLFEKQLNQTERQLSQIEVQNRLIETQNKLFGNQNDLTSSQNTKIDKQNNLANAQNNLFNNQNNMLGKQNEQIDFQNNLLSSQNELFKSQNQLVEQQIQKIVQQSTLIEADRRSSLIAMLNGLISEINKELNTSNNYDLNQGIIARIISLTHYLKPYKFLEGESLVEHPMSPEKGQLLVYLLKNRFKEELYDTIYANASFDFVDLSWANLDGSYMKGCDLIASNLYRSNLKDCNLSYADLFSASLENANLENAILYRTNMWGSNLTGANLKNAKVESKDWFQRISNQEIVGLDELAKKYRINETPIKGKNGIEYFKIVEK